jgi:predicted membrane protein
LGKKEMNNLEERIEKRMRRRGQNTASAGLFLLVIGGLLLAKQLGAGFPAWFFTWPMLLIGIGLFIGVRHGFRGGGWLFPIVIGAIFLADRISDDINLRPFLWPIIIIGLGLFFIFKPRRGHCFRNEAQDWQPRPALESGTTVNDGPTVTGATAAPDSRDFIDTTSVFGGIKKNVLSKNLQGGEIVNFMGGSEIDLTQSDFTGRIRIETTNVFGGTKLIVPPTWDVQSEVVAVFGGVDDRRNTNANTIDPNKLVVIEGTCLFGGIEIRSF